MTIVRVERPSPCGRHVSGARSRRGAESPRNRRSRAIVNSTPGIHPDRSDAPGVLPAVATARGDRPDHRRNLMC
jgi:hypothetical protein